MKAKTLLIIGLLSLTRIYAAQADAELFLRINSGGVYTVQLADQTITLSNGRYRFFDLTPGQRRLTILRNGVSVYRDLIELRPGSRVVVEYSPQYGIRVVATIALNAQGQSRESDWYDTGNNRPPRWNDRPNGEPVSGNRLSAEDFERIRQSLTKEPFDDRRIELLRVALPGRILSAAQLVDFLKIFSFDKQRLEAAKLGWSCVGDQQNFYRVFDTFTFSTGVKELKEFIESR